VSASPFEQAVLPHLNAAYNLARWLTRNDHDAEDVVQDAYVRALRFFGGFRGDDARAWLLAIVRNTCYDFLRSQRPHELTDAFDEEVHTVVDENQSPEVMLLRRADQVMVRRALESLPLPWREVIVLRELEGLSYKQIADATGIKIGTVMSRLARARARLQHLLGSEATREVAG
jgi:RNA polymerase sigma factor (sigma-70 family)